MGDYGANPVPDVARSQIILRNYGLIPDGKSNMEEWPLDSANRVTSFRNGSCLQRFKVKYDPRAIDLF